MIKDLIKFNEHIKNEINNIEYKWVKEKKLSYEDELRIQALQNLRAKNNMYAIEKMVRS